MTVRHDPELAASPRVWHKLVVERDGSRAPLLVPYVPLASGGAPNYGVRLTLQCATPRSVNRLIRQPTTDVQALDGVDATSVGILLGATGTRDIADAHVVVCAKRAAQAIVTSDPEDLLRLDPSASLVRI